MRGTTKSVKSSQGLNVYPQTDHESAQPTSKTTSHNNWVLTASHTVLSISLNIRTIRLEPWIQHEKFLECDPPSMGENSTSAAVDLEHLRATCDATDKIPSNNRPHRNKRTEGDEWHGMGAADAFAG